MGMFDLSGRVAIVSGTAQGIGHALTEFNRAAGKFPEAALVFGFRPALRKE